MKNIKKLLGAITCILSIGSLITEMAIETDTLSFSQSSILIIVLGIGGIVFAKFFDDYDMDSL